jgi:hypothetical protein
MKQVLQSTFMAACKMIEAGEILVEITDLP